MNLYALASKIKPNDLEKYQCKIVWKHSTGLPFVFLAHRGNGAILLMISGMNSWNDGLLFYELQADNPAESCWVRCSEEQYNEWKEKHNT